MVIYNLADTFFVGMLNDPVQNAAVTLAAPVLLAFNAINNLFGVGSSSMMSRALGRKDYETVWRSSAFGFYCALICGATFLPCMHRIPVSAPHHSGCRQCYHRSYRRLYELDRILWCCSCHPERCSGISGTFRGCCTACQHRNHERDASSTSSSTRSSFSRGD